MTFSVPTSRINETSPIGPLETNVAPRKEHTSLSRPRAAFAAAALALTGCQLDSLSENLPEEVPPSLETTESPLTLAAMNPPPAPIVLPFANGAAVRIAQRAHDDPSHDDAETQFATDFAVAGLAYAPVAGVVHRRSGNCPMPGDNNRCDNGCNGGWGAVVEIDALDGSGTYIIAHCQQYDPSAPDNTFVTKGTPVCTIGCTGHALGVHPHLDRVNRNGNSYTSIGVPGYITFESGNAEPTLETPDSLSTCCANGCDARPGEAGCKTYTSFNRDELGVLSGFIQTARQDPRVVSLNGPVLPDPSVTNAAYVAGYQQATLRLNGRNVPGFIYTYKGSTANTGNRNPFISTGSTFIYEPNSRLFEYLNTSNVIHTQRYVNFDLWDYARTYFHGNFADSVPFTQNVQEFPNWSPDWHLYATRFQVGGRTLDTYLAVAQNDPSIRYAILLENGVWTNWTQM